MRMGRSWGEAGGKPNRDVSGTGDGRAGEVLRGRGPAIQDRSTRRNRVEM